MHSKDAKEYSWDDDGGGLDLVKFIGVSRFHPFSNSLKAVKITSLFSRLEIFGSWLGYALRTERRRVHHRSTGYAAGPAAVARFPHAGRSAHNPRFGHMQNG
jgi:hypothetical protein